MKIFVTGGSGFLGTALCRRLRDHGHEVCSPNSKICDLTRSEALQNFASSKYDQIYHLAAWTQAGDFCLYHPGEQWLINQQINTNVLAWWKASQPQAKLIFMGTSCSYPVDLPLREENYLEGRPIESLFTYAMTKRMLYVGAMALQKQFGLRYLCAVPSTLYGPGYHTDGRQMHFIFDLIRKILRGKLYDEPVVLWGDGHQRRELVYLDDFIDLLLVLAEKVDNELVNIGAGEEFSIRHFAGLICETVGYDLARIEFDSQRYTGARSKCLNIEKLIEFCGPPSFTPLEKGIARTVEWFLTEKERVLKSPQG